jgi:anti-sigma factor RsiW
MNCDEARTYLTAHLDGELDVVGSTGMERHLAECAACRRLHEEGLALRGVLRGAELYWEPPAALAKKVEASVRAAAKQESRPSWFAWRWTAAGALAVAGLLVGVRMLPVADRRIEAEVVASHVRSLQADHLMDVASSDRHTVKPWFQGKLDYSPPVPDLTELAGGRLDYVNGRPVAALVYRRRQHRINVFVWPGSGSGRMERLEAQGYQIVHWNGEGMTWWAISDLNAAELMEFSREMGPRVDTKAHE